MWQQQAHMEEAEDKCSTEWLKKKINVHMEEVESMTEWHQKLLYSIILIKHRL